MEQTLLFDAVAEPDHLFPASGPSPFIPAGSDPGWSFLREATGCLPVEIPKGMLSPSLVQLLTSFKEDHLLFKDSIEITFPDLYSDDPSSDLLSTAHVLDHDHVLVPHDLDLERDSRIDIARMLSTPSPYGSALIGTPGYYLSRLTGRRVIEMDREVEKFDPSNRSISFKRRRNKKTCKVKQPAIIPVDLISGQGFWRMISLPYEDQGAFHHNVLVRPDTVLDPGGLFWGPTWRTHLPARLFDEAIPQLRRDTECIWTVFNKARTWATDDFEALDFEISNHRFTAIEVYYELPGADFEALADLYLDWLRWAFPGIEKRGRILRWETPSILIKIYDKDDKDGRGDRVRVEIVFKGKNKLLRYLEQHQHQLDHAQVHEAVLNAYSPYVASLYLIQALALIEAPDFTRAATRRLDALLQGGPPVAARGWRSDTRDRGPALVDRLLRRQGQGGITRDVLDDELAARRHFDFGKSLGLFGTVYGAKSRANKAVYRESTLMRWTQSSSGLARLRRRAARVL